LALTEPGSEEEEQTWRLAYHVLVMGSAYLMGVVIYVTHFPEVWRPGRFDNCCASHQLWHCCIVVAAYILYIGLREHMLWRAGAQCQALDNKLL
jgi:adiponectin receptor